LIIYYSLNRTEKKWEELQIEMGELPEARPQEGSNNTTRRKHNSRAAC